MKSQKYQQSAEDRTYLKCFHMTMSEFNLWANLITINVVIL